MKPQMLAVRSDRPSPVDKEELLRALSAAEAPGGQLPLRPRPESPAWQTALEFAYIPDEVEDAFRTINPRLKTIMVRPV